MYRNVCIGIAVLLLVGWQSVFAMEIPAEQQHMTAVHQTLQGASQALRDVVNHYDDHDMAALGQFLAAHQAQMDECSLHLGELEVAIGRDLVQDEKDQVTVRLLSALFRQFTNQTTAISRELAQRQADVRDAAGMQSPDNVTWIESMASLFIRSMRPSYRVDMQGPLRQILAREKVLKKQLKTLSDILSDREYHIPQPQAREVDTMNIITGCVSRQRVVPHSITTRTLMAEVPAPVTVPVRQGISSAWNWVNERLWNISQIRPAVSRVLPRPTVDRPYQQRADVVTEGVINAGSEGLISEGDPTLILQALANRVRAHKTGGLNEVMANVVEHSGIAQDRTFKGLMWALAGFPILPTPIPGQQAEGQANQQQSRMYRFITKCGSAVRPWHIIFGLKFLVEKTPFLIKPFVFCLRQLLKPVSWLEAGLRNAAAEIDQQERQDLPDDHPAGQEHELPRRTEGAGWFGHAKRFILRGAAFVGFVSPPQHTDQPGMLSTPATYWQQASSWTSRKVGYGLYFSLRRLLGQQHVNKIAAGMEGIPYSQLASAAITGTDWTARGLAGISSLLLNMSRLYPMFYHSDEDLRKFARGYVDPNYRMQPIDRDSVTHPGLRLQMRSVAQGWPEPGH